MTAEPQAISQTPACKRMVGAFVDHMNSFRQLDVLGNSVRDVLLLPPLVLLMSTVRILDLQFSPRKSQCDWNLMICPECGSFSRHNLCNRIERISPAWRACGFWFRPWPGSRGR